MQAIIDVIPVGAFQCNCVILGDPRTRKALVIDPGDEVEVISERIRKHGLEVTAILHTHHCGQGCADPAQLMLTKTPALMQAQAQAKLGVIAQRRVGIQG